MNHLHINFSNIEFSCPYCGKQYEDSNDKYLDRCNRNKSNCTTIKCECGEKFGMTYDIQGDAVGFKILTNNTHIGLIRPIN
jgi:NAD-dependent SIR2 family protein deacetylase